MQDRVGRRGVAVLAAVVMIVAVGASALACGSEGPSGDSGDKPRTLLVAAAASLKDAFADIGKAFDAANNTQTTFTFDASGTLQTQIEGGAPVDVFASAAWKQVNNLLEEGLVDQASTVVFASNEMVVAVPVGSTLAIASFEDLTKGEIGRITTSDPETSPQGKTAVEVLTTLGIVDEVRPKLIYAKNSPQTLAYVRQGEVDAGIMFSTDAAAGGEQIRVVAVSDPDWHSEIAYVLTTVSAGKTKDLAQTFIDFVTGSDGQAILATYGFLSPPED